MEESACPLHSMDQSWHGRLRAGKRVMEFSYTPNVGYGSLRFGYQVVAVAGALAALSGLTMIAVMTSRHDPEPKGLVTPNNWPTGPWNGRFRDRDSP